MPFIDLLAGFSIFALTLLFVGLSLAPLLARPEDSGWFRGGGRLQSSDRLVQMENDL
jgi:hypothetical protein